MGTETALAVEGTVQGKTIKLTWRKPPSAAIFNVRIGNIYSGETMMLRWF
jgi:hypothetical protein